MNKIKNLFKASPIAMVVASLAILAIAGVASAAIVSYISNAPTATVTVSSPVDMKIYEGAYVADTTGETSITLTGTFGGSSLPFTTLAHNNANNRIGGYYVTVIEATGSDLMTGQEFTKMMFNKNKGSGEQDITGALCVVKADGTLTPLSTLTGWVANKKLIIFYDSDGNSTQQYTDDKGVLRIESTGVCSPLVPYIGNETRSFSHLDVNETEKWTFTPTWNTGTLGNFVISAQYVNNLAEYAAAQY